MQIERGDKEILIRVAANTPLPGLQRILDYIRYKEIVAKSKATQSEIDNVAAESKGDWWGKNKDNFLK